MQVEIACIGNELLWGYTVNTNAAFLSRELSLKGYSVSRHTVLSDDPKAIAVGLRDALQRVDLVIATGGLGPTLDDLTRQAVSPLFSEEGKELKNSVGGAPGVLFSSSEKCLILLPGVPREMERMFIEEVLPKIGKQFPLKTVPFIRHCSLCLLREIEVDPVLREIKQKNREVEIGIFPSLRNIQIVFRSEKPVDRFVDQIEKKFPTFFYGEGRIEEAVHREMIGKKKKLALAESCTGGAIAACLTAIPEASRYLLGSIVAYSNSWKERFLLVAHSTIAKQGAVSKQTVEEMVEGLFAETDADYAIAVSGTAGPSGGTKEKPVGTIYIAIGKRGEKTDAGLIRAPQNRASGIELSVHFALGALWRRLVHNTMTLS